MKVFISYTHDSLEHDAMVLRLSNLLREKAGIDSDIDQYYANRNWPLWMEEKIAWAERILVVCSETYLRRWKNEELPGVGLGAQWESLLTRQELYENPGLNEKYIPVVFDSRNVEFIPTPLRNVTRVVIGQNLEGFDQLLNRISGKASAEKPPINTSLAAIPCAEGFFTRLKYLGEDSDVRIYDHGLHEEPEELFSNLFPVKYPEYIYQAKAKVGDAKKFLQGYRNVWNEMGNKTPASIDFWSERGMIYSFSKFDTAIWKLLEKSRDIHPKGFILSDNWAQSESQANKSRFIKLMNRALDHLCENNGTQYRISRSAEMNCHLFARKRGRLEGKVSAMAIRSQAPRTVFKAIPSSMSEDPEAIQHWKHVAFRHRFVRHGKTWYLVLTPFWAFTSDGVYTPSRWQKKSSFNMQKPEKNRAVLGHVTFWASVLCRDNDLLDTQEGFGLLRPTALNVSPSIRDSDWVKVADEQDKADFKEEEGLLL